MSVRRHPLLWSLGVWSALFVVPVGLAATNDLSFSIEAVDKVTKTTWPTVWTLLTVSHARVIFSYAPHVKTYLGQESPSYGFPADGLPTTEASCTDFVRETTVGSEHVLKFKFANHGDVYEHGTFAISVKQKGMNSRALLQQVKDACGTQQIEEDHRAQIEREEAERKRKEADAAWQADVEAKRRLYEEETRQIAQQREEARLAFAKSILAALRFADEPDPFASVRGEFDLSASDSRQWKTSLQLAGADKCALLKTPPANPPSPSAWTFGCVFHASSDGYEGTVKSVGSILNLPFQPDEKAVGINQVFFADPSKPARRVFVAKINEATTRIAVVALPSSAAPVEFDKALLPV
ncbi:MAG TPA: hypothetical protein VMR25_24555, partial [Planctomycetaceae bacterium]|nr:hypothetical protein [Planctomycetaceae bacterium]